MIKLVFLLHIKKSHNQPFPAVQLDLLLPSEAVLPVIALVGLFLLQPAPLRVGLKEFAPSEVSLPGSVPMVFVPPKQAQSESVLLQAAQFGPVPSGSVPSGSVPSGSVPSGSVPTVPDPT